MRDKAEGRGQAMGHHTSRASGPYGPLCTANPTADSKSQRRGMQSPSHQKQQDSLDRVEVLQLDLQVK